MATVQATLSQLDKVLKDRPLTDAVQEALNKATPFAEEITQELTLSGRKGIFPVQFGVNEGIYMRADGGSFGNARANAPVLAEVQAKFMYALFEITGPLMSATRDNPGAFEDGLALSIENTVDGLKLDAARQYIGDGSGFTSIVQATAGATDLDIRNPFGIDTRSDTFTGVGSTHYKADKPVKHIIRADMEIETRDQNNSWASLDANIAITSATPGTALTELVVSSMANQASLAEGDGVVRSGNYNIEIQGFLAAVDTAGTYLGVTRSGNSGWQGTLTDITNNAAAAASLEPDDVRDFIDKIIEDSGQIPEFMVGNYAQRRNVYNLGAAQIRYGPMNVPMGINVTGVGSDATVSFDGMRFVAERYWPSEHIGFVNTKFWYHAIDKDVEWIEGINGTVLHFLLTSDSYRAVMRTYRNMACLYPQAQGLLYGISE
jgi:hypothetical protein